VQLVPASSFQGAVVTIQAAAISQRRCPLGPALALAVLVVVVAEVAVVLAARVAVALVAGVVAQLEARFSQVAVVLEEEGLAVQVVGAPAVLVVLVVQGLLARLAVLDVAAVLLVTPLMELAGLAEAAATSRDR
jgi:hypothetical protein